MSMTFTMGGKVVRAVPCGFTKHRLNVYELKEEHGVTPPPHPMLTTLFQFKPPKRPRYASKADLAHLFRKPVAKPTTVPAVKAPTPVPVTTQESSTMPKTTTTEKTAKINAYLATVGKPALTEEQATELLKQHEMSPKRVIRTLKGEPAVKAAGTEPAAELKAAILAKPEASGLSADKLAVAVVADKPKRKAKAAAVPA